ncbi:fungal specific transcription factor [Hirsutella rhossiliensis]|uniref:Fungal specific transcription factor domain-containing protein n=1 Tax=Hirsutella rhossiliensis TaxID=111463 RepID=A0A9P8SES9_9HYPO|nr:fungal specific transcription factor domain-containing protein [Hirsutella rhossiliensis]KAH0960001.1 fungal specific transcription factor domain-containing protein [Hirsutella rhossiliensis]
MGCRVCRARKVKCDGRPNGCRNCERLELDCLGGAAEGAAVSSSSPRKIRTYRSCQSCRLSKTKCNGVRPCCARCAAKGLDCLYDGGSAPRWTSSLTTGSLSPDHRDADDADDGGDPAALPKLVPPRRHSSPDPTTPADRRKRMRGPDHDDVEAAMAGSHPLTWLLSPELPAARNLRRVVEQYFANVHPLRCFAFVHKPSFMRQLDRGLGSDDESALLHVICAHGARFLVLGSCLQGDLTPPPAVLRTAGNQWAKRAEYLMLANFGKISVQRLMTAILLHDFHFRLGEYGQALMLSGLAVRMAHALKINTEWSPDVLCADDGDDAAPSVASRESRRRLMWACYVLDAWAGSGVEQLTLLRENDIKIQLPCNERNFGLRIPSITETLAVGHVLQFLPPAIVPRRPAANMGIMAYYIRVVALWKKIVRYVNHLPPNTPPWQPDSPFAALDADLHHWRRELPDFVEYSAETIYARLDSNQFGALVLIHCTYHHNYLELYKLTMPDLFKLAKPLVFPPEHRDFLQTAQANCYYHARRITDILADAAEHGARFLSDSLLPFFVYDSSRVMLYYVARLLDPNWTDAETKMRDAIKAVENNSRVLRLMSTLFPIAQSLSVTIERWLFKVQQTVSQDELVSSLQSEHRLDAHRSEILNGARASPPRDSSEYLLPPLSLAALSGGGGGGGGGGADEHGEKRPGDESPGASTAGWSTVNPNAGNGGPASWDGTSLAAHQLMGLSQEVPPARSGLQHERPVSMQLLPRGVAAAAAVAAAQQQQLPMCERLDLDDLQNFLSWDMYGIMEMGGGVSNNDMDDSVSQSWTGAI